MWQGYKEGNAPVVYGDYIQFNAVSYCSSIEFIDLDEYMLEFDIINSKGDRIGISIGEPTDTQSRKGYIFFKDVGNCLVHNQRTNTTIVDSLLSNLMSSGTHHILIRRENNIASLYCDNTFICDLDMSNNPNNIGSNIWGSGNIKFTNFNLHSL